MGWHNCGESAFESRSWGIKVVKKVVKKVVRKVVKVVKVVRI